MELIIGFLIFFLIYQGYVKNSFSKKLATFAISYEVVFNVGYMIYRSTVAPSTSGLSTAMKGVAASHGILSLIMLFVIIGFFLRAKKEYAQNMNSFLEHRLQTLLFCLFWSASLLSGIFLYVKVYF
jgi:hypothetical protein